MPLPSFGFGHRPSWEYEAPDGSGAALEEPQPHRIRTAWRGKVALVSGGATGLGRHIAIEFARLGCHVGFCFVNMPGRDVSEQAVLTEAALTAMGVSVLAVRCDVRDRHAVDRFVAEARQRLGGVHFLINNAGIANDGALWRLSEDAWREVLDTNVTGAFNCIRAVAPIFRGQHYGKIVSVSAHQAERQRRSARQHPHKPVGWLIWPGAEHMLEPARRERPLRCYRYARGAAGKQF